MCIRDRSRADHPCADPRRDQPQGPELLVGLSLIHILPIQSLESIRRTLSLCGANIPGKLYLALEEANAKGGAEAVREAGLKFAVQQIRTLLDNGAPGIHLYTLNKASMCLRIAEEVGAL